MSERPSLKPAYLISGSDRPKVETAVQRLRARFVPESVEIVSALEASGADVVNLCNSGSLFGDARLVVVTEVDGQKKDPNSPGERGLEGCRCGGDRDLPRGACARHRARADRARGQEGCCAGEGCAKAGDLLLFDVAKRGRVAWVAERFRQAGVKAETDACALLVEYVGEDDLHGLANEIAKIATWAQGEPVGVAEIEQLVSPVADVPPFALTDAWADRHPGRLLDLSETLFDRSDKPRRDTAPRLAATLNGHLTRMRQLKRLAAQGVPAREAATTLKMHPFYGEKVYRQAEAFSDEELAGATVRFAELDLALKGGSRLAPDVELLRALIDVSAEPDRQ